MIKKGKVKKKKKNSQTPSTWFSSFFLLRLKLKDGWNLTIFNFFFYLLMKKREKWVIFNINSSENFFQLNDSFLQSSHLSSFFYKKWKSLTWRCTFFSKEFRKKKVEWKEKFFLSQQQSFLNQIHNETAGDHEGCVQHTLLLTPNGMIEENWIEMH